MKGDMEKIPRIINITDTVRKENGRIKASTTPAIIGKKRGLILRALYARSRKEKNPKTPAVAKSSRAKLEDLIKGRFQISALRLNVAGLNLVKSERYVPYPEPNKNP